MEKTLSYDDILNGICMVCIASVYVYMSVTYYVCELVLLVSRT